MKRLFSLFFMLVLSVSVFSFSSGASFSNELKYVKYDLDAKAQWDAYFTSQDVNLGVTTVSFSQVAWDSMNDAAQRTLVGEMDSYRRLVTACETLNAYFNPSLKYGFLEYLLFHYDEHVVKSFVGWVGERLHFRVGVHDLYGHVIYETNTGLMFCNQSGAFPYYDPVTTDPDTGEEVEAPALGGKWVRVDKVSSYKNVINEATLNDLVVALATSGESIKMEVFQDRYKGIQSKTRFENGIPFVYCDSQSRQYVMLLDENQWAVDDSNDYYTGTGGDDIYNEGDTENNTLIDIDTNTAWFPDGTLSFIDTLIYDESTKTYYVDAHQEYDIDNNTYITNNYHYEYHIDYTSITYIGQTEEYNKTYELYYQLPDGRSSADLTAEELLALNTQIDVLPYIRSADDTSIRALYHFDGDTQDSSYWSHLGEFKWNKGASITYMDAGAFEGALYLDENEHDFTITLPSNLGSSDFTLQFRYYQSYTPTPVTDSYMTIDGVKYFQFDGQSIMRGTGAVLTNATVGAWQELAVVRSGSTVNWYHNGVVIGSTTSDSAIGKEVRFVFGSEQQTYKYFDEFRVVSKALYSADGYTPTSVPYDTNLALVLPDSKLPVADAYWSFTNPSQTNIFAEHGLDEYYGTNLEGVNQFKGSNSTFSIEALSNYYGFTGNANWNPSSSRVKVTFPNFAYFKKYTTITSSDNGILIDSSKFPSTLGFDYHFVINPYRLFTTFQNDTTNCSAFSPSAGIFSCVATSYGGTTNKPPYYIDPGEYTLSIVLDDGSVGSVTFTIPASFPNPFTDSNRMYSSDLNTSQVSTTLKGYEFGFMRTYANLVSASMYEWDFIFIRPESRTAPTNSIVYMELVEGNSTDLRAEYVESVVVMDKDDLNTPSLAVRTDLEITGHQIGGVRPSLPEKGLVWAMVESGRITSLQIYNGQAWEQVDGRIWTGSRWVPYYAYDLLLLKDLYDIVESDPSLDYIYTEAGFWKWLQNAWGEMMKKLDQIITLLGGTPGTGSTCEHVYDSKITREPGCVEPGNRTYTCSKCQHTYVELIDATGHDWIVTNSVPDVLDEDGSVVEEGYDELTCSVCDTVNRDYGDGPEEVDLFDALGDFIADGITWILDKLTELADSLRGITEIFNSFRDKIAGMAGGFPLFFAGFVALLPEDLMAVFWFAVIGFIILAVWKKWSN